MSNAHRIGQITKAEIEVAGLLDSAPADATHERMAAVIVQRPTWS